VNILNKIEDFVFRNRDDGDHLMTKKWYFFSKMWSIEFEWVHRDRPLSRFGGGWRYVLGFQIGSTSLLLNFLLFSIWIKKER